MPYNAHGVKTRVLFAGLGSRVIGELMEKISDEYETERCVGRSTEFLVAITKFQPHAVVICMQNELIQELNAYYPLAENDEYANLPVIITGKENECETFKGKILIQNLTVMERPLNVELFITKLDMLTKDVTAGELPRQAEVEQVEQVEEAPRPIEVASVEAEIERKSVLVVDDNVLMLNTIKSQLHDLYDVTVVPNGKLALKFLAKKHADLVLLDYLMPDMDGPEVLTEIRKDSDVPVLFLTGVSDRSMVMKSLELKPSGYLLKPISKEDLIERVTEVMLGL